MKKTSAILLVFLAVLATAPLSAQEREEDNWNDSEVYNNYEKPRKAPEDKRFLAGGSIGASFGTITSVDVSPLFGYRITDMFRAGIGFTYQYINNKQIFFDYKLSLIGGRAWAQHDIIMGIFAHAEYEYLNARFSSGDNPPEGSNYPSILLGGGYAAPIGEASALQIQILYPISVSSDPASSINPPVVFRSAIMIGF